MMKPDNPADALYALFLGPRGLAHGIRALLDNHCEGPALVLIYSTMDVVSSFFRPPGTAEGTRKDFIKWCDSWLRVKSVQPLRGADFYGARCAVVHAFSAESNYSRQGKARPIIYRFGRRAPDNVGAVDRAFTDAVTIEVEELFLGLLDGIERSMPELYATPERIALTQERLRSVLQFLPYSALLGR